MAMLGRRRWTVGTGIAALALTFASPALAACKVGKIAELPVTLIGQRAMVQAKFGDRPTQFILDSGAFYSTISRATAAEFKLEDEALPPWFRIKGVNGDATASAAVARNFSLAGIALPKVDFIVAGTDTGSAGLIGQNILGLADVEYDLPHGMVRLMKVQGCNDMALAYWANGKPFSTLKLETGDTGPWKPHTIATVLVNGVKLRAAFDTGAQTSVMTLSAAKRAGITPQSPGVVAVGRSSGLGSKEVSTWLAPFDQIDLGGEIVPRPKLRISDIHMDVDMLIGFDFFLTHRVFVSNVQHRLYMTYEGGAVFGLRPSGARTTTGEALDLTDKAAEPTDAEGFARRGAVHMSAHRMQEGLADFDKAVAMAPSEGRFLVLRAQARLANRQLLLAAADLDKAAMLMPNDPDIRLSRASLRLANRDPQGAAEEVAAADKLLAPGSDRRLRLAGFYNSLDKPEAAIVNYDAWLKLHGEDADRAIAYNGRCWARAMLGRDLEKALSDCNTAIRLRPAMANYLDSRGLVNLKLNRLDAALTDYDAAVKASPHNAWMLYSRSIAAERAGRTEQAAADRKAALAIDPHIGKRAVRYGLEK